MRLTSLQHNNKFDVSAKHRSAFSARMARKRTQVQYGGRTRPVVAGLGRPGVWDTARRHGRLGVRETVCAHDHSRAWRRGAKPAWCVACHPTEYCTSVQGLRVREAALLPT
mmetsp:Transcript_147043/g.409660  ORF Transcript_147043/g.409660 Transcript_147043/m.409660 type:complete len:111 (-) Transcript_147043:240-572(-)